MQRIKNVDACLTSEKRIYLYISFTKNIFKRKQIINENLIYYELNYFIHFFNIINLTHRCQIIYIHSIWNYLGIMHLNLRRKRIILDVHGVVPEELAFYGKKMLSKIFSFFERRLIKKLSKIVFVNNSMKSYYNQKYGETIKLKQQLVYPIFSYNVFAQKMTFQEEMTFKKEIGIDKKDIVFIYSGNLQKWQNFDAILASISLLNRENNKFIILTNDFDLAQKKLSDKIGGEFLRSKIILKTVSPLELYRYYQISNYGFILRDNHVLNKVSMPTKLIEYLFYGIIPIVDYVNLGDFERLGYEYISKTELSLDLPANKSLKNQNIAHKILNNNSSDEFQLFVLSR